VSAPRPAPRPPPPPRAPPPPPGAPWPRPSAGPRDAHPPPPPNPRRLFLTALVVGAKFLDDRYLSNGYYGRVGGVTLEEMNAMEAALLEKLGWRATVREADLAQVMRILEEGGNLTEVGEG